MTGLTSLWRQCRLWDRAHDVVYCDPNRVGDLANQLTMEREENREVIAELEAELRALRPSPGDVR